MGTNRLKIIENKVRIEIALTENDIKRDQCLLENLTDKDLEDRGYVKGYVSANKMILLRLKSLLTSILILKE